MKKKIFSYLICSISFFSFIIIFFYLNKINVVPEKYMFMFLSIELFIIILYFLLCKSKKLFLNIIGILLSIIIIGINSLGYYYLQHFDKFIDSGFAGKIIDTTTFYVITSKENSISNIDELTLDNSISYYSMSKHNSKARAKLGEYEYTEIDNVNEYLKSLKDSTSYLLVDSINYSISFEYDKELNIDDYKTIYSLNIETSEERNNEVKDSYNILIMGKDFSNERNDLNMIITVNTVTRKVLITSIPRDYYIPTSGYKYKDSLMVMGILGDDVVIKS